MMAAKACTFCGREVMAGTGITYITNDGAVSSFCSSKCRKSTLKLRRDPRKLKWSLKHVKGPAARGGSKA